MEPVYTEADNNELEKLPEVEEVKSVLFDSNLNAAPGTDGITSLLYKVHWDILGEPLHQVVTAIHEGEQPTLSQRTSLIVFGNKPKKSAEMYWILEIRKIHATGMQTLQSQHLLFK